MKRTAAVSIILLAGLALGGCSASDRASDGNFSQPDEGLVPQGELAEGGGGSSDGLGEPLKDEATPRSIIVTGYMNVIVEEPIESATTAVRIVEGVGGRIDGRKEYAPVDGDKGSATLTLRIPTEAADATIDKLKELGEVEEVSTESDDVTSQVRDIEARIKGLQASVDRLTALLATASDVEVLVSIEQSLSNRTVELESLLSQQRSIGDDVDMATITLSLISEADAPADPAPAPATFLTGLEAGWNSFATFILGAVAVFGVLLPWLAFFGIIAAAIVFIVRRRARRRSAVPAP